MSEARHSIDVSRLPTVSFGHHSLVWWGTLGFIVIEAFTITLTVASYFYLRLNELGWPPGRTPRPDVLIPTINTILLLVIIVPMHAADKAAKRYDRSGVIRNLLIATALTLIAVILRWFELMALNASYDANAYASVAWAVVVFHGTLIGIDLFETGTLAALFIARRAQKKHYPDVSDAAFYQYYLSISWVPLYRIVFWGPRFF